jgi:pimeloyl-ACP methyl ester carboxylesterase
MWPRQFVLTFLVFVSCGCLERENLVTGAAPREKPGVVFLVSGIGGLSPLAPAAKVALPLAGVEHELREFQWQHGKGRYLRDLQDSEYIMEKATELASEARRVHESEPNRRVYLVGHSAGTAVVIHAVEMLPPGSVERVILLSSALSPNYDLTSALRATHGEIVSFYSQLDRMVLDWGTRQFGTADRFYVPAAGLSGFAIPANLDADGKIAYERLVQVPWTVDKALDFQGGWHHSTTMPWFLARQVAVWLKDPALPADNKAE